MISNQSRGILGPVRKNELIAFEKYHLCATIYYLHHEQCFACPMQCPHLYVNKQNIHTAFNQFG